MRVFRTITEEDTSVSMFTQIDRERTVIILLQASRVVCRLDLRMSMSGRDQPSYNNDEIICVRMKRCHAIDGILVVV